MGLQNSGYFSVLHFYYFRFYIMFFFKNEKDEKINFLLLVIVINTVLVGILAPNDGITITGRYLILTIIPLLILWETWNSQISKKWKTISVVLIIFFVFCLWSNFSNNATRDQTGKNNIGTFMHRTKVLFGFLRIHFYADRPDRIIFLKTYFVSTRKQIWIEL
nr:putative membrane protein [Leptospira interrogans serovar Copenhageni/Icterohaemorrhagiae]